MIGNCRLVGLTLIALHLFCIKSATFDEYDFAYKDSLIPQKSTILDSIYVGANVFIEFDIKLNSQSFNTYNDVDEIYSNVLQIGDSNNKRFPAIYLGLNNPNYHGCSKQNDIKFRFSYSCAFDSPTKGYKGVCYYGYDAECVHDLSYFPTIDQWYNIKLVKTEKRLIILVDNQLFLDKYWDWMEHDGSIEEPIWVSNPWHASAIANLSNILVISSDSLINDQIIAIIKSYIKEKELNDAQEEADDDDDEGDSYTSTNPETDDTSANSNGNNANNVDNDNGIVNAIK